MHEGSHASCGMRPCKVMLLDPWDKPATLGRIGIVFRALRRASRAACAARASCCAPRSMATTVSLAVRDPVLYVSRCVLIVILICAFGLIYVESRAAEQAQVMPRLFLLNWVCVMPSILNLITVLALNQEYTNARAEMKNVGLCANVGGRGAPSGSTTPQPPSSGRASGSSCMPFGAVMVIMSTRRPSSERVSSSRA